jgi:hypothetical protein
MDFPFVENQNHFTIDQPCSVFASAGLVWTRLCALCSTWFRRGIGLECVAIRASYASCIILGRTVRFAAPVLSTTTDGKKERYIDAQINYDIFITTRMKHFL